MVRVGRRQGWLAACLLLVGLSGSAGAANDGDAAWASRRTQALDVLAKRFRKSHYTPTDLASCSLLSGNAAALLARLELARLGRDRSVVEEIPNEIADVARSIVRLQGTSEPGPCARPRFGGPAVTNAAATIAYALHRYGADWPPAVSAAVRSAVAEPVWPESHRLTNLEIAIPVARILVGEATGDDAIAARGSAQLREIVAWTAEHGGIELNSPLYSSHHWVNLAFLTEARDPASQGLARALLEYELLVTGHLYLPGGGISAPQSRDYAGGGADEGTRALLPLIWLLTGDPGLSVDLRRAYPSIAIAATDYRLPAVIRAIFLDKGSGYEFRARHEAQQGSGRTPHSVYRMGLNRTSGYAWHSSVLAGGRAAVGLAYGTHLSALVVTYGVYLAGPTGHFARLYQYQPATTHDTDHLGRRLVGAGLDDDPGDFAGEGYDFERLLHGNAALSLWDPRPVGKARRRWPETRVHLPDLGALGGRIEQRGDWWLGELEGVLLAYRPAGPSVRSEEKDGSTQLRLAGPSGGVAELALSADVGGFEAWSSDVQSRHFAFSTSPLALEFDKRSSAGDLERLRLEYRPEKRMVGGRDLPRSAIEDVGLVESAWVDWSDSDYTLTVARPGFPVRRYDWKTGEVTESAPATP